MSIKPWRWIATLTLTAVLAAGCSTASDTPNIRVGIVCGGIGLAALTIDEGGLPDGVQAQQVCFDSGSSAVQALAGGSIDAFVGSADHIVNNRAKGLDVKGYAVVSENPPYSLVSPASAPVARVADLAGKSVAVTAPGSLSDTELQRAAAEAGIPYKGLHVVAAGTGATMQATVEKGGAAAGMVSDPLLTTMVQSGEFTVTWKPSFRFIALTVIARSSWVDRHKPTMQAFLTAVRATRDRAQSDPTGTLATARKQAPALSPQALTAVLQATLDQAPAELTIDEGLYQDTTEVLVQVGQTQRDKIPSFSDSFDFSLVGHR
ncbi:ABC transporter substrate-binding protein [Nocardia sp. NPDC049220]|uniref:ABC transporter substrate-binding protein n=1 Tax=Nocardia sp. NPDC049220 TaxID=3155273 RepID=UPI0033DB4AA2